VLLALLALLLAQQQRQVRHIPCLAAPDLVYHSAAAAWGWALLCDGLCSLTALVLGAQAGHMYPVTAAEAAAAAGQQLWPPAAAAAAELACPPALGCKQHRLLLGQLALHLLLLHWGCQWQSLPLWQPEVLCGAGLC
jgi:hypothetical protein